MNRRDDILLFLGLLIAFLVASPLNAQEKASPKPGEGITSFLQRLDRPGAAYRKEFIRLNKGKFGKNNSLLLGVEYTLPPSRANATVMPSRTFGAPQTQS